MVEARRVTIGGTINLENFENFRYEFEGVVTNPDDYVSLAGFTAGCLLHQAANADPFVRERIRKHIVRTFGIREEDLPDVHRQEGAPEASAPAASEPAPVQQTPKPAKPPAPGPEAKASKPAAKKAEPAAPAKTYLPPVPKKAAAEKPAGGTCTKCGAPITESQAKLSQLFMNKPLCKPCMEAP